MAVEVANSSSNSIQAAPSYKGLNIVMANELPPWGISVVWYGAPGVGKTTVAVLGAADSEYGRPVLMVDAEGGARAVTHRKDVAVLKLRTIKELVDLLDVARRDSSFPYKTIVLDNLSEIQAISMRSIVGAGLPSQADWNVNTNRMLGLVRAFRDVSAERGINTFFVAWDKKDEDQQTQLVRRELAFNPALAGQIPGIVDMVGFLSMGVGEQRILTFAPSTKNQAKFRRDLSEAAQQIPLTMAYKPFDPILLDILATLKGGKPFPAQKYRLMLAGPPKVGTAAPVKEEVKEVQEEKEGT